MRESEDLVARRRALGERLTAYRQLAGLTQQQLGKRLYCDRTTVVRLEAGQRGKDRDFWQRADDHLQAHGWLLAAFTELEAAKADHARRARDAELAIQRQKLAAWKREPPQPAVEIALSTPVTPTATTPGDIAAIQAMATAFQAADRQVGGGKLYGNVLVYLRDEVGPRLFDPASDTLGLRLFAAAASLTELVGWMAHDGGNDQHARHHFGQSYRLALVTNHPGLTANVCASMSHLASQLGEATNAVRLADVGLSHARRSPARHRLSARLHAMRARGLATNGERRACVTALGNAANTLDRTVYDEPTEWVSPFDEGSLAVETALCLRELHDLAAAEDHARRVLALRDGDRIRSRAFGQLTLADVLLAAGGIDEAAALGREVTIATTSLTSARVKRRLDILARALEPHDSAAAVKDFLATHRAHQDPQLLSGKDSWPV